MLFLQEFPTHELAVEWLSVVSLISSVFLLLTYAILAPEKSHRHYLSVGLIVSNVLLQVCSQSVFNTDRPKANSKCSWPSSFHWGLSLPCATMLSHPTTCIRTCRAPFLEPYSYGEAWRPFAGFCRARSGHI